MLPVIFGIVNRAVEGITSVEDAVYQLTSDEEDKNCLCFLCIKKVIYCHIKKSM